MNKKRPGSLRPPARARIQLRFNYAELDPRTVQPGPCGRAVTTIQQRHSTNHGALAVAVYLTHGAKDCAQAAVTSFTVRRLKAEQVEVVVPCPHAIRLARVPKGCTLLVL